MSEPTEQISSQYGYLRGRQLEGTFSSDKSIGVWLITAIRVRYGWGDIPESAWPRAKRNDPWPPKEPSGLDDLAKQRRHVLYYQRIRDLADCRQSFKQRQPVCAAFDITDQWFRAPLGAIPMPGDGDEIIGAHAVCLLGMSDDGAKIIFVNSWGKAWGNEGFGYMPSQFFEKYFTSAWTKVVWPTTYERAEGVQHHSKGFRAVLGSLVNVREIYNASTDERIGWAIAVARDEHMDVEDFFVRPAYRNCGYGRDLAEMLRTLAEEAGLPLRIWFSHADEVGPRQERLCASLGLTIVPSGVLWSPCVAVANPPPSPSGRIDAHRPTVWSIS